MENSTQIVLVKDINPGEGGSSPRQFIKFNEKLYFSASDGVNGSELWVSDGTSEGTVLVKDINPGSNSSIPFGFRGSPGQRDFTKFNGQLYFRADDGENGVKLWVSDGTSEGTQLFKDITPRSRVASPSNLTELDGLLYFDAFDNENGSELWVSDGTSEGTVLVKDINPGSSGSSPNDLTEFDGLLYFGADDGVNGSELWVSDGTSDGTVLVKDINPGEDGSFPNDFIEFNNKLFFGVSNEINGQELWVSDGTSEGTVLVKDINPGLTNFGVGSFSRVVIFNFIEFNEKLYFDANDGVNGSELWVSDGTSEGTRLVKDINPEPIGRFGQGSSFPREFTEFNGKLYFTADDGVNGSELWVTDGTSEGTVLVADIPPGTGSSNPSGLTVLNGELYFSANKEETGSELYKLVVKDPVNTPSGTNGADNLIGTNGNDLIDGKNGNDTIKGAKGNDTLYGDRGSDNLFGGVGDDNLFGGSGADILNGGGGDDALYGDRGSDNLFGAIGDDSLFGGIGDDTINGSGGNDVLTGGGGSDVFILQSNRGKDIITDFEVNSDRLSLAEGLNFEDLSFSNNKILANEQILATLNGINTQELTEASFEQFEL